MKATLMSSLILPGVPTPRCTTCFSSNFTCSWTFMCFANNFISLLSPLNGVIDLMSSRARMAEPQIISIRTDFFSLWFFRSFTHLGQTSFRYDERLWVKSLAWGSTSLVGLVLLIQSRSDCCYNRPPSASVGLQVSLVLALILQEYQ